MLRILVVEDDRSVRETLGMVLEAFGYRPELVESGEAALAALGREWADLMFLDLTLDGMTGEQIHEGIRHRFGRTPWTVVLSAATAGESRARKIPGVRFLPKPFSIEQVMALVREAESAARAA